MKVVSTTLLCMALVAENVLAQHSVVIGGSKTLNTLMFKDSGVKESKDDYHWIPGSAWKVGYQYTHALGIQAGVSIGTHTAGSAMVYDSSRYSWDLEYADIIVGIGYVYQPLFIQPYVTLQPTFSFLLEGEQVLDNEHLDVDESKSLNTFDFALGGVLGARKQIVKPIIVYTEISFSQGLTNMEKDKKQTANHRNAGLGFGLNIQL